MKNLFKLLSILGLVGLMTFHVSIVSAASKIYHSSECSARGKETKGHQYEHVFRNYTSGSITVVCPIVRTNNFGGGERLNVRTTMIPVAGKSNYCILWHYDEKGRYVASDYENVSSSSYDPWTLHNIISDKYVDFDDGSYVLSCTIPPSGGLYSYGVWEIN